MSTRGLYGFRKGGKDKLMYNHYDSYPTGLGAVMAGFCQATSREMLDDIWSRLTAVKPDRPVPPNKLEILRKQGVYNEEGNPGTWYWALHGKMGEPGYMVKTSGPLYYCDDGKFILDSCACEYAYIINLDTNMLEFWVGYQVFPQKGNRYGESPADGIGMPFYPCRMAAEYDISKITSWQNVVTDMKRKERQMNAA